MVKKQELMSGVVRFQSREAEKINCEYKFDEECGDGDVLKEGRIAGPARWTRRLAETAGGPGHAEDGVELTGYGGHTRSFGLSTTQHSTLHAR
jgi:hypothetical protein